MLINASDVFPHARKRDNISESVREQVNQFVKFQPEGAGTDTDDGTPLSEEMKPRDMRTSIAS